MSSEFVKLNVVRDCQHCDKNGLYSNDATNGRKIKVTKMNIDEKKTVVTYSSEATNVNMLFFYQKTIPSSIKIVFTSIWIKINFHPLNILHHSTSCNVGKLMTTSEEKTGHFVSFFTFKNLRNFSDSLIVSQCKLF